MGKGVANHVVPRFHEDMHSRRKAGMQSLTDDVRVHNQNCPNLRRDVREIGCAAARAKNPLFKGQPDAALSFVTDAALPSF